MSEENKVVKSATLTLGNSPAECSLTIDGKKIENIISIVANVTVEDGPYLSYVTLCNH